MVSMPAEMPVTLLPEMPAWLLLAPQVPPPVASDNVMVLPVQTENVAAEMAEGVVTTVTVAVAVQLPTE